MHLEFPLAAPSANRYGKISPTSAKDVYDELNNKIPLIIDGGRSSVGVESTIIDLSSNKNTILRHGFISCKEIEKVLNCRIQRKNYLILLKHLDWLLNIISQISLLGLMQQNKELMKAG